ncbi:PAS domain-containing sensor histidine kinase [Babesia caballi]|uniref:PAS domain-containing sensor histidine kinase n=1 Tax=Babesia caballi TaxID=5871 RepID=A0AAV4LZH0_BABCB|nr:PAS domain-containing sensor histidine kinase [Babesia caballi]
MMITLLTTTHQGTLGRRVIAGAHVSSQQPAIRGPATNKPAGATSTSSSPTTSASLCSHACASRQFSPCSALCTCKAAPNPSAAAWTATCAASAEQRPRRPNAPHSEARRPPPWLSPNAPPRLVVVLLVVSGLQHLAQLGVPLLALSRHDAAQQRKVSRRENLHHLVASELHHELLNHPANVHLGLLTAALVVEHAHQQRSQPLHAVPAQLDDADASELHELNVKLEVILGQHAEGEGEDLSEVVLHGVLTVPSQEPRKAPDEHNLHGLGGLAGEGQHRQLEHVANLLELEVADAVVDAEGAAARVVVGCGGVDHGVDDERLDQRLGELLGGGAVDALLLHRLEEAGEGADAGDAVLGVLLRLLRGLGLRGEVQRLRKDKQPVDAARLLDVDGAGLHDWLRNGGRGTAVAQRKGLFDLGGQRLAAALQRQVHVLGGLPLRQDQPVTVHLQLQLVVDRGQERPRYLNQRHDVALAAHQRGLEGRQVFRQHGGVAEAPAVGNGSEKRVLHRVHSRLHVAALGVERHFQGHEALHQQPDQPGGHPAQVGARGDDPARNDGALHAAVQQPQHVLEELEVVGLERGLAVGRARNHRHEDVVERGDHRVVGASGVRHGGVPRRVDGGALHYLRLERLNVPQSRHEVLQIHLQRRPLQLPLQHRQHVHPRVGSVARRGDGDGVERLKRHEPQVLLEAESLHVEPEAVLQVLGNDAGHLLGDVHRAREERRENGLGLRRIGRVQAHALAPLFFIVRLERNGEYLAPHGPAARGRLRHGRDPVHRVVDVVQAVQHPAALRPEEVEAERRQDLEAEHEVELREEPAHDQRDGLVQVLVGVAEQILEGPGQAGQELAVVARRHEVLKGGEVAVQLRQVLRLPHQPLHTRVAVGVAPRLRVQQGQNLLLEELVDDARLAVVPGDAPRRADALRDAVHELHLLFAVRLVRRAVRVPAETPVEEHLHERFGQRPHVAAHYFAAVPRVQVHQRREGRERLRLHHAGGVLPQRQRHLDDQPQAVRRRQGRQRRYQPHELPQPDRLRGGLEHLGAELHDLGDQHPIPAVDDPRDKRQLRVARPRLPLAREFPEAPVHGGDYHLEHGHGVAVQVVAIRRYRQGQRALKHMLQPADGDCQPLVALHRKIRREQAADVRRQAAPARLHQLPQRRRPVQHVDHGAEYLPFHGEDHRVEHLQPRFRDQEQPLEGDGRRVLIGIPALRRVPDRLVELLGDAVHGALDDWVQLPQCLPVRFREVQVDVQVHRRHRRADQHQRIKRRLLDPLEAPRSHVLLVYDHIFLLDYRVDAVGDRVVAERRAPLDPVDQIRDDLRYRLLRHHG